MILTHNATSFKLPASANITTAAGDIGFFLSQGSGNWKCLHFSRVDGSAVASFNGTLTSTDASAANGPIFEAYRNSPSPAVNDEIGEVSFSGSSSTGVKRLYGGIDAAILDPTNGSEDAVVRLRAIVNGSLTAPLTAGQGVQIGNPTGGDKGVGSLNSAAGVYIAGHGTIAQVVRDTDATYSTTTAQIPDDNTIPQQTEGTEIMSATITPTNAGSKIRIRASVMATHSVASNPCILSLFQDATSNAIAATMGMGANTNWPQNTVIEAVVDAVTYYSPNLQTPHRRRRRGDCGYQWKHHCAPIRWRFSHHHGNRRDTATIGALAMHNIRSAKFHSEDGSIDSNYT